LGALTFVWGFSVYLWGDEGTCIRVGASVYPWIDWGHFHSCGGLYSNHRIDWDSHIRVGAFGLPMGRLGALTFV
jgi:hypothetical protein